MSDPLTAAELRAKFGVRSHTLTKWWRKGKIAPVSGQRHNRYNPLRYDPERVATLCAEGRARRGERQYQSRS